jgi:hypothetical protein
MGGTPSGYGSLVSQKRQPVSFRVDMQNFVTLLLAVARKSDARCDSVVITHVDPPQYQDDDVPAVTAAIRA